MRLSALFSQEQLMRRAFTVVELLVVIAIIGVLTALILPAVQMAREASRLASCRNNLKQIAIGAQAHAEAFEYYPNAGGRDGQPRSKTTSGTPRRSIEQDWGWAYQILPYIEKQDLYVNPNDVEVAGLKFKGYFCPTRRPPKTVSGSTANGLAATVLRGGIDYAGNGGGSIFTFPANQSYSNQTGVIIPRPGVTAGMFSSGTTKIDSAAIVDGTSNVVMFGERNFNRKPIGAQADEDNGYFNGWSWDTIRWGRGRPVRDRPIPDASGVLFLTSTSDLRFGSAHSGVCLLAMCDGSVKAFSYGKQYATAAHTDDEIFKQLTQRSDNLKPTTPPPAPLPPNGPIPNPQLE
jgi:prepilin-type N-terminal cleavage/methylation domain-containing protein